MSKDEPRPLPEASPGDRLTSPDSIDQKSVLLGIDGSGKPGPLRLTDLAEEAPLPELKM